MGLIGILVSVLVTLFFLIQSAEARIFIDVSTLVFVVGFVYGLTAYTFGISGFSRSVSSLKYMFVSDSNVQDSLLARIFKSQIIFSLMASLIGSTIGLIAIGHYLEDYSILGSALSIVLLSVLYPLLLIGFVFYPMYIKFSVKSI